MLRDLNEQLTAVAGERAPKLRDVITWPRRRQALRVILDDRHIQHSPVKNRIISETEVAEWRAVQSTRGQFQLTDSAIGALDSVWINGSCLAEYEVAAMKKLVPGTETITYREPAISHIRWLRDYFLRVRDHYDDSVLLASSNRSYFNHEHIKTDSHVFDSERFRRHAIQWVPTYFEGGDMAAIGSRLFVGQDSFDRYLDHAKADRTDIGCVLDLKQKYAAELYDLFGRTVSICSDQRPLVHLDLYATFLPDSPTTTRAVVMDFSLYLQTVLALSAEHRREEEQALDHALEMEWEAYSSAKQFSLDPNNLSRAEFFRRLRPYDSIDSLMSEVNFPTIAKFYASLHKQTELYVGYLESQHVRCVRVPMAMRVIVDYEKGRPYNHLVMKPPCNGLTEIRVTPEHELVKQFYMPTFGMPALDKVTIGAFNQVGYSVTTTPGLMAMSLLDGSLHCLTNESRRPFGT